MATGEPPATELPHQGGTRRRIRVPTSLVFALVGGVLTILIVPAFTRQWEERQRALDLKSELVEEISIATSRSITSAEVVFETFGGQPVRGDVRLSAYAPGLGLRRAWLASRLKIEGRLRAYFSRDLFQRWSAFDGAMVNFLYLAGLEGRINKVQRQAERPVSAGVDESNIGRFLDQIPMPRAERSSIRGALLDDFQANRRLGLLRLESVMLDKEAAFTDRLLAEAPQGFSTTRRDLINDLLP